MLTVGLCASRGAGKWFPRMLQWADRQWRWRNPYTGHVMRYFDDTDIVTQLPTPSISSHTGAPAVV